MCIVDEAAQCTEPQALIPLCLNPKLYILVGDSQQLEPTIISQVCKDENYGRSLFERLESNRYTKFFLNIQYRMRPEISLFPNNRFYKGLLRDSKSVSDPSYGNIFGSNTQYRPYVFYDISIVY